MCDERIESTKDLEDKNNTTYRDCEKNSKERENNLNRSSSEDSLYSECRVDRKDREDREDKNEECGCNGLVDNKDNDKDICNLNLKTRAIGMYNRKPINIIMKGKHYYLKYDGFLYNIPEWAKEINIKQDFTIYHAIGIIEWTVNNKGEGFRN